MLSIQFTVNYQNGTELTYECKASGATDLVARLEHLLSKDCSSVTLTAVKGRAEQATDNGEWQALMLAEQRRSWCIAELMLAHPDWSRDRAAALFDKAAAEAAHPPGQDGLYDGERRVLSTLAASLYGAVFRTEEDKTALRALMLMPDCPVMNVYAMSDGSVNAKITPAGLKRLGREPDVRHTDQDNWDDLPKHERIDRLRRCGRELAGSSEANNCEQEEGA